MSKLTPARTEFDQALARSSRDSIRTMHFDASVSNRIPVRAINLLIPPTKRVMKK